MLSDTSSAAAADVPDGPSRIQRLMRSARVFWIVFAAIHLAVGIVGVVGGGFGDVLWYRYNVLNALATGAWPVIDNPFVYPAAALVVILAPLALGPAMYVVTWTLLVFVLNSAAVLTFVGRPWRDSPRLSVAWWWAAFLLLLGPTALGRVDSVSVPIVVIALTVLVRRPVVSGALLALAGWIKIWPIAIFMAVCVALKRRWYVFGGAVLATVAIIGVFVLLGAREQLFSFLTAQDGRSLQAEAVFATPWLWIAMLGGPAGIYYNNQLLTNEIYGVNVALAADVLTPIMLAIFLLVTALAMVSIRFGAERQRILPPLALALTLTLIVFNKVGSPQFVSWLAPAVILGLVLSRRSFIAPAVISLAIAAMTQIIFPTLYGYFLWLDPALIVLTTARNLLLVLLWAWCLWQLARLGLDARSSRVSRSQQLANMGADGL